MQAHDDMMEARELSLAAVLLQAEAQRRGGYAALSAAQIHALATSGPDWPGSGAELAARVLPRLARRPGYRGVTVRKAAGDLWDVSAAPMPPLAA